MKYIIRQLYKTNTTRKMKKEKLIKRIFICGTLFLNPFNSILSQVTIGSGIKPNEGVILDLKEKAGGGANSTRGLALPRVQLTTISSLDDIDTDLDKNAHIGLTIYVPKEFENNCPGVYIWMGSVWNGINTDASKAPEFITETDIDGNVYTAKIFKRNGCKGGTYWFTSNLRTTKFNDGTPVASTKNYDGSLVGIAKDDKIPILMADGKTNTWEIPPYDPIINGYPFDETNTKFHVIRNKSDISTGTDKTISFYENGVLKHLTQDEYATKFGLLYVYNMAFEGDYKGTIKERGLLCPKGWKIPEVKDWLDVVLEMGATNYADAQENAAEYLGSTDWIKPVDEDIIFTPENIGYDGYAHFEAVHPVYGRKLSWFIRRPRTMSRGLVKNAGLNIYAIGNAKLPYITSNDGTGDFIAEYRQAGSYAYFLNIANGAITIGPYKGLYSNTNPPVAISQEPQMGGSAGDHMHSSVRCIKVVK